MYTQELICPNCYEVATINVITSKEKKNPQSALCRHCSHWIDFDVDARGEIMDIRSTDALDYNKARAGDREPRW
jgi:hypothetical protein